MTDSALSKYKAYPEYKDLDAVSAEIMQLLNEVH